MTPNEEFLIKMRDAAAEAGHPYPEYAACEAALETAKSDPSFPPNSNFGRNEGYLKGWNVFGNQQKAKPVFRTIQLSSWESNAQGVRRNVIENWIAFPDLKTAFVFRLQTLNAMAIYYEALHAATGVEFVRTVSAEWQKVDQEADPAKFIYDFGDGVYQFVKPRWSTGQARATTVLQIYNAHKSIFGTQAPVLNVAEEESDPTLHA